MRLSKIKLAGFKSFVDPTTIPFPSSLVGVVGPNGCGKSNVIDAVRWVMGESLSNRPLLLLGVLLILLGIQVLTTGLIGEMITIKGFRRSDSYSVREVVE